MISQYDAEAGNQVACRLVDLSTQRRTGLRGRAAQSVLAAQSFPFPPQPNQLLVAQQGQLVARLGRSECWVLDDPLNPMLEPDVLDQASDASPDCYPLYCQHSHVWFALISDDSADNSESSDVLAELMAKLCAVDLRLPVFPPGSIAQTSVARVNAIVIRHSLNQSPAFFILSDRSSADYLWHTLIDAMQEFNQVK